MNTADEGPHWLARGIMLVVVAALAWSAHLLMLGSRTFRIAEAPQHVALVDSAPPPPPPSAPVPEPLPEEQENAQDAPTQGIEDNTGIEEPGPSRIDDQLGVDADAQAGFDSFGLRAKRGGRDLALDLGKPENAHGGGSGGFGTYTTRLAGLLRERLNEDQALRRANVQVRVRLWLDAAGTVARCRLTDTTGDAELDRLLVAKISGASFGGEPPPPELPQPITILIRSRDPG
jgi:TonB family protein